MEGLVRRSLALSALAGTCLAVVVACANSPENWLEFSDNRLWFSGGLANPVANLDRNFKDPYHPGVGVVRCSDAQVYSIRKGHHSSPVEDNDRTIDLPLDEQLEFSVF
jgi:hypothetical protein